MLQEFKPTTPTTRDGAQIWPSRVASAPATSERSTHSTSASSVQPPFALDCHLTNSTIDTIACSKPTPTHISFLLSPFKQLANDGTSKRQRLPKTIFHKLWHASS